MSRTGRCPRCEIGRVSAHFEVLPAEGEADVWAPVREESYWCHGCDLIESCLTNAGQAYAEFRNRWNDPIEEMSFAEIQAAIERRNALTDAQDKAWTWPDDETLIGVHDPEWRKAELSDRAVNNEYGVPRPRPDGRLDFDFVKQIPVNEALFTAIVENPDSDAERESYSAWLRTQHHPLACDAADFIDAQLALARSWRADPRNDIKNDLPVAAFPRRKSEATDLPDREWWRHPGGYDLGRAFCNFTEVLLDVGLIDDPRHYRGFVEHVAIKASRFLEIADELYALAPIRQLTITYCKGIDHQDAGLLRALLDSPHLDRIRAISLPVRKFGWDKDVTELNRLTDADVKLIAESKHLSRLAYLRLEDQRLLTIDAFDSLATSANLRTLSAVTHDLHLYRHPGTFTFGTVGKQLCELADRPLARYAPVLERHHGRIPWLHVAEDYATESPDPEAVVEHPVALLRGPT